jgi:hypothetical protein
MRDGKMTDIVLRGVTPEGFIVEGTYQPDGGLCVPAVLVTRAGTEKTIKCPDRALACLRRLGVEEFVVDVSRWDPGQAFNPTRESFLSRQRRQNFEAAQERIGQLLERNTRTAEVPRLNSLPQQKLQRVAAALVARVLDEIDLRALTVCWCDVFIARFPIPEQAEKALLRYARGAGIEVESQAEQLSDCCRDEFKRRCKNQYLSSLDLGEAG